MRMYSWPEDYVVVTAASRQGYTERIATAGGVLPYLIKPFPRADLHGRLADYLHHRRLVDESAATPMDQQQVDRLLGAARPRPSPTCPRGWRRARWRR